MPCDTCGAAIKSKDHQMAGARYCSAKCAPKWKACECEIPWEEDDHCVKCGRFLLPRYPKRAGRLVPPR